MGGGRLVVVLVVKRREVCSEIAVGGAVRCAERHRTSTLPRPFAKQTWAIGLRIGRLAVGAGLRSARDRHGAMKGGRGSYTKRQGVLCCSLGGVRGCGEDGGGGGGERLRRRVC